MLKNFVYFNRNDPRVWVYRHEKYKAIGVTFNFAKTASWLWMAARDLKRYPGLQSARPETKELPECVRGKVGIIPAGEGDSVEEYHRHLVEKYDSVE